jgi:predicted transcriptional regulator
MARHRSKILTERELEIMNALWDLRRAKVRDIRERMGGEQAGAYTSVATMLRFLERKSAVKHSIAGRTYYFEPRISRERAGVEALQYVLRGFYGDNAAALIKGLLSKERLSEAQRDEILSIISEAKTP